MSFWRGTRTSHSLSCYTYGCHDSGSKGMFLWWCDSAGSFRVENFWKFSISKMVVAALRPRLYCYYLGSLQIFNSVGLSVYMHLDTFLLSLFGRYSAIFALRPWIQVWIASHSFAARFPKEDVFVQWYVSTAFSLSNEKVLNRMVSYVVEVIRKWKWVHAILMEPHPTLVSMEPAHWVRSRRLSS